MFKHIKTFFSFSVDDLNKAKSFYGGILGLGAEETKEGLELKLDDNRIFIYAKPNHVPATFTVLNFVVDDIEKSVHELSEAGVKFEIYNEDYIKTDKKGIARPTDSMPGPAGIAWFKDPAGNFLSVIQE